MLPATKKEENELKLLAAARTKGKTIFEIVTFEYRIVASSNACY